MDLRVSRDPLLDPVLLLVREEGLRSSQTFAPSLIAHGEKKPS